MRAIDIEVTALGEDIARIVKVGGGVEMGVEHQSAEMKRLALLGAAVHFTAFRLAGWIGASCKDQRGKYQRFVHHGTLSVWPLYQDAANNGQVNSKHSPNGIHPVNMKKGSP